METPVKSVVFCNPAHPDPGEKKRDVVPTMGGDKHYAPYRSSCYKTSNYQRLTVLHVCSLVIDQSSMPESYYLFYAGM
jgi:hypothetical protein